MTYMSTEVVSVPVPDELRDQIRREERDKLTAEIRADYQAQLENEIVKIRLQLTEGNKASFDKIAEEYRKGLTPPGPAEVQAMLDGEAISYPIRVPIKGVERLFTLHELPARIERKFIKLLKDRIGPFSRQLGELTLNIAEGEAESKITAFFGSLEPAADFLAEGVALILQFSQATVLEGDELIITVDDVADGLSLSRQIAILTAQFECNKLRDFFVNASRLLTSG